MIYKISAISRVLSLMKNPSISLPKIIKNVTSKLSKKVTFKVTSKSNNARGKESNRLEFLLVCLVNYRLYVYKFKNPGLPEVLSETSVDIPATCLGDSDIINLDEFSEIVLGQIVNNDPNVNLPTYILVDPEYFSSETTCTLDSSENDKFLSLSPFVAANTIFTISKFNYSKSALALFERSQKYLGSISKLHNSADIDLKHLGSKDFVRLDFSNRDFMQKITAPFAK